MARTPSLGDTIIRATAPPGDEESAHDRPRASAMSKQPCARVLLRALRRLCCYADEVTLFSRRLPHVLTRSDLVLLLAPTYAKARLVDDDEASERLARALAVPAALDELYAGVSAALIRLDLEIGMAPESMRATLATPRGRALLDEGLRALGAHVVKELLRG